MGAERSGFDRPHWLCEAIRDLRMREPFEVLKANDLLLVVGQAGDRAPDLHTSYRASANTGCEVSAGSFGATDSIGSVARCASRRYRSIATRRAIVASHGPISRLGSRLLAARHAFTNACWVASSASARSESTRNAIAYTSRPYAR